MFSERQQQIVEAAIKIIAEKGIQNLTTRGLAAEVGVTEAALYRHFKGKNDILKGVLEYFKNQMQPAIGRLKENRNPVANLEAFMLELFRMFNANGNFSRVIFSESNFQNHASLMAMMNNMMNNSRRMLEEAIARGQKEKKIRTDISSTNLSRLMIGSIRFLVTQWSVSGMVFNLENEGRQLCKDIIKIMK
ncbi:MAG: TetR/AcrR family transcriptional regulator [Candidatus Cloacimonetes bacterium]|nr:TetR/AcrR family transcriptional regulator [Candidatus Cloacimonadota bacterium]